MESLHNYLCEMVDTHKAQELEPKWEALLKKKAPKDILNDLYAFLLEYKVDVLEQFIDEATETYNMK